MKLHLWEEHAQGEGEWYDRTHPKCKWRCKAKKEYDIHLGTHALITSVALKRGASQLVVSGFVTLKL